MSPPGPGPTPHPPLTPTPVPNAVMEYAGKLLKSEIALTDAALWSAFQLLVEGECLYLPSLLSAPHDHSLFLLVVQELDQVRAEEAKAGQAPEAEALMAWSEHWRHAAPWRSQVFEQLVRALALYFQARPPTPLTTITLTSG